MKRCTKKEFLDLLCNNGTDFGGLFWNKPKKMIESAMERVSMETLYKHIVEFGLKTVKELHCKYIVFSDNSRLSFDQDGNYKFYVHLSKNGILFVVFCHEVRDPDKKIRNKYMVYAIPDLTSISRSVKV